MAQNKLKTLHTRLKNSGYSWKKMTGLFLLLIGGALALGLFQAALVSKDALISRFESYVNFANPTKRFVYIYPGMRREEMVEKYAKILNWEARDERWFIASAPADAENGGYHEGYFLPKSYFVDKDATGKEVGELMHTEFLNAISEKVLNKPTDTADGTRTITSSLATKKGETEVIDLDTAIRIASIIQREAEGPHDMPLVSGIIWNRIFLGMKLDLDATLQYVKGDEDNWWPQVASKDKFLDSPYNTYKYKGVPPGAISNPSIEAINAVYNPQKTDCIFYIHDKSGDIHCAKTYEEHKRNIDAHLR
jgi:UPF0755 protein